MRDNTLMIILKKLILLKITISMFVSSTALGIENFGVVNTIDQKITKEISQIYLKDISRLVTVYNNKLIPSQSVKTKFLRQGINYEKSFFQTKLPIAVIKNNTFMIPEINFSFTLKNYLEHSFNLNAKTIKINCKKTVKCHQELLNLITLKSKSFQSSILDMILYSAYADDEKFNTYISKNLLRVYATILKLEEDAGGLTQTSWFNSSEENKSIHISNYNKIKSKVSILLNSCDDMRTLQFINPNLPNFITKLANRDMDDDDVSDILEEHLGQSFNAGASISSSFKVHYYCKSIPEHIKGRYQRSNSIYRHDLKNSRNEHCEKYSQLKSCLSDVYTSKVSISTQTDENYDDYQEAVNIINRSASTISE
jgi:hypothetical protein